MIGVTGILFTSIMIDEFPWTMVILYCTPPMIGRVYLASYWYILDKLLSTVLHNVYGRNRLYLASYWYTFNKYNDGMIFNG